MSDSPISKGEVLSLIVRLAALTTVSYYTMKLLMDAIDPTRKQKLAAQKRAEKLLKRYIQIYIHTDYSLYFMFVIPQPRY